MKRTEIEAENDESRRQNAEQGARPCEDVQEIQSNLLNTYFFNRLDTVPYAMKMGEKPTTTELEPGYDAATPHLQGHYRVGSYALSIDSTAKWTCLDFDGKGHAAALADVEAAALKSQAIAAGMGITMYLEKSGGGNGWHGWIFYNEPIPGPLAREIGLAVVPKDVPLEGDGFAEPESNRGIEVFPKGKATVGKGGFGAMVWLPFFPHAASGANLFYRTSENGTLEAYLPREFTTVPAAQAKTIAAAARPAAKPSKAPSAGKVRRGQADADGDWNTWRREAVSKLPLEKIYGEYLTGKETGSGWLECRDPDSQSGDQNPSAGVADVDADCERGSFHSFRDDRTLSVFDFLMEQGEANTFREALHIVAQLSGVSPPKIAFNPYSGTNAEWVVEHCVPVLDKSFVLLRAADGTERVFSVNERNEATLVLKESHLEQALHDHLKVKFEKIPPPSLLSKSIDLWNREGRKIQREPEPFCFRGDDRLCFKRFDWEPTPGDYSAWQEFLSRLSESETFMAFVWSCFEPKNSSRQYVWLRGEGQDGKSKVLGVLQDVFGQAATGISNSHFNRDNRFLFSAIYGKRVVMYGDCKNMKVGMSEYVRNFTSGDQVMVEYKGQTPFSARLYVKLFIASNPKPEVSGQNADLSRMIYIEAAESKSKDDPSWPEKLRAELPAFLHACREQYQRLCPHHGDIRVGDSTIRLQEEAAAAFEERFHVIFDAYFHEAPGAELPANTAYKIMETARLTNNEMADFKAWMLREHKVKFHRTKKKRWYANLARNPILGYSGAGDGRGDGVVTGEVTNGST